MYLVMLFCLSILFSFTSCTNYGDGDDAKLYTTGADEENSIVSKYKIIQKGKPEQKSQNIIQKKSYNPFDEDASFFNALVPIIKQLNSKQNKGAKLEIVKLLYGMTTADLLSKYG
ncbi:uncharacterized protein LOC142325000 [Lycorma delicatula]|uniref:uncharacterized protein LOC142325000 n=1 Tax=Lycorma delicatula TaxID=130591 RepID=UPI003F50F85B